MAQRVRGEPTTAAHERGPGYFCAAGVEVSYSEARPTVIVTGDVNQVKITEVSTAVQDLATIGDVEVIVDLTEARDAAALLTVLARTRADLADHGGALRLVGVADPEFPGALDAAPLDEVFLVYDPVRRPSGGPA